MESVMSLDRINSATVTDVHHLMAHSKQSMSRQTARSPCVSTSRDWISAASGSGRPACPSSLLVTAQEAVLEGSAQAWKHQEQHGAQRGRSHEAQAEDEQSFRPTDALGREQIRRSKACRDR